MFELLPYMYFDDDEDRDENLNKAISENNDVVFMLLGYLGLQLLSKIK